MAGTTPGVPGDDRPRPVRARPTPRTAPGRATGGTAGATRRTASATGSARATGPVTADPQPVPVAGIPAPAPAPVASRLDEVRARLLPRSVMGIASLILAFAIGAGFSGVVLFSYYQYKLNQTNAKVNNLISGYKTQFSKAESDLSAAAASAIATIQGELKSAQQQESSPATLAALVKQVAPSVFFVHTLDASGQASVGTGFVVSSSATQSLVLTSYTTVAAATHSPAPPVYVQRGSQNTQVTVQTWDTQHDLALLTVPLGNLKPLGVAPTSPAPQPGDRLFAVSGLGSAGASIVQATVVDVSSTDLALDAAIGTAFQGGPVINQSGQVVAVASRTYSPNGFSSSGVWFVPYVDAACSRVLSCPGGSLVGTQ